MKCNAFCFKLQTMKNGVSGLKHVCVRKVFWPHRFFGGFGGYAMVVYDLLNWHAPPILILVSLLVQWNCQIPHGKDSELKS